MSDDKAQQEPSMEDILASIRRILSEDEAEDKGKAPEPEPEPEPMAMPSFEPEPEPAYEPEPMAAFSFEPDPEPEPEPEDDVLELTDDMVLEPPRPEPTPVFDAPSFGFDDYKRDLGDFEPEPMPMPRMAKAIEDDDDSLLSEPVAHRSTSLLSDLAREIVRQRGIGLGNGGITLEDMVRELLRPVLKEWLDQNLPYMIERIIKKEIEKMVNRAENY